MSPRQPVRSRGAARLAEPPADPSNMTPRQQERRERLIEAGLALLNTRDYDEIQVKDVAEQADVALGTLYNYFSSKEHLFAEVLIRWGAILRTSVARRPLREGTTAEQLTEVLHRAVRGFQRQPQLARLVSTLVMSQDAFASEILGRLDQATNAAYLDVLRHLPDEEARAVMRVVNSVFSVTLRDWSLGRRSIVDFYDSMTEVVYMVLEYREGEATALPGATASAPAMRGRAVS